MFAAAVVEIFAEVEGNAAMIARGLLAVCSEGAWEVELFVAFWLQQSVLFMMCVLFL